MWRDRRDDTEVTGYRPPLPASGALLAWPTEFGQRFTIFVDTEEEFDWTQPLSREARSVSAIAALPEAAARFAAGGAPLTLLVDHPVATEASAIDHIRRLLTDDPRHGVGTQLHPWVNPPFDEAVTPRNSFVGNLPEALHAAKLDVLTDAITAAFGAPRVYRAGRYGIGPATLRLLAERGYRFDSSVRARYDYSDEQGPDFSAHGNHPYIAPEGVIELPLTTVFTGWARRLGPMLHRLGGAVPKGHGLLSRSGALNRVALTPEDMPLAEALEAVRIVAGEGLGLLHFSFHSPSLVAGHTPYVRDASDLAVFWAWWDAVLALLDRLGIRAASLDDLLAAADASGAGGPGRT